MSKKKFAVPTNIQEIKQLKKKPPAETNGCELNRTKKRQAKILRKRLNPLLKRDFDTQGEDWDEEEAQDE